MKVDKVTISEPTYDKYGNIILMLTIPRRFKLLVQNLKEKLYDIEFKKHRERRSNNANSYLWVLCEKIAEAVEITKEDVYRDAIKNVGIWRDYVLPQSEADTLKVIWNNFGTGWVAEQVDFSVNDNVVLRCYYGSSVYNTKQMSRLIDYVVNEAKNLDIETKTPDELLNMKSQWEGTKIA